MQLQEAAGAAGRCSQSQTLNLHLQEREGEDGNSQAGEQTENY